jgi:7-carboxy-7-deazaguanine synthase
MFGPTLQGEGRSQGKATMFLRLGLCNLDCAWCDTPYTWDWTGKNGVKYDKTKELFRITPPEIRAWALHAATNYNVRRVVVTGGEPLLQQRRLAPLFVDLVNDGIAVEVETNGTVIPCEDIQDVCQFNVSPKLSSSGVSKQLAFDVDALKVLAECDSTFKFVVSDEVDLMDVDTFLSLVPLTAQRVHLMPEGRTRTEILDKLPWLFDVCATRGWNLSPRLHVLAFNDKRGV